MLSIQREDFQRDQVAFIITPNCSKWHRSEHKLRNLICISLLPEAYIRQSSHEPSHLI